MNEIIKYRLKAHSAIDPLCFFSVTRIVIISQVLYLALFLFVKIVFQFLSVFLPFARCAQLFLFVSKIKIIIIISRKNV